MSIRVKDIIDEVSEVTGTCQQAINFQAITRAVQLLANKKLIDPLQGYLDITADESFHIALPRDVKTVLKVNINNNPSFARSRLFEFGMNTEGTVEGEEVGWSWADRLYSPIQNEKNLPGPLAYKLTASADNGKTCIVKGLDEEGREITETLTGSESSPTPGAKLFHKILSISRDETSAEALLWCNGENVIAQFYGDEVTPSYRVIKLSKKTVTVRIYFRREFFKVTGLNDVLPMQSAMAVIHAARAVRFYANDEDDKAMKAEEKAVQWLKEEQEAREENNVLSDATEVQTPLDATINVREGIIVRDVYDVASSIFGPIGRGKLFDKITTAVETLANKAHWDAGLGYVDLQLGDRTQIVNSCGKKGTGLFILPRFVEAPVAIILCKHGIMPRNQWFEFNMNGGRKANFSDPGTWDHAGETPLCQLIPIDADTKKPVPTKFVAIPNNETDDGTEVRIFGFELDGNGIEREVWRENKRGWLCPCTTDANDPGAIAPAFVRIERITKGESVDYIKLYATSYTPEVPEVPATPDTTENQQESIAQTNFFGVPATMTGSSDAFMSLEVITWGTNTTKSVIVQVEYAPGEQSVRVADAANPTVTVYFNVSNGNRTITFGDVQIALTLLQTPTFGAYARGIEEATIPGTPAIPAVPGFWTLGEVHGYYYPDELEPRYRIIRVQTDKDKSIRVCYRKRTLKFTSLLEPIPLRSRLAIECQLRAINAMAEDPQGAVNFETLAVGYLTDARIQDTPNEEGSIQFDEGSSPMNSFNLQ